ncbi:MAG: tetratricopeptide repeat protein [Candidatus Atribacteria bacterium]|nr:tetratricopeptide repeat protein [Candidatus Atribacteria bacterium]
MKMIHHRLIYLIFLVLLIITFLLGENAFPQDAETYYKNGYIYFSQNNFEKAKEAYQKAIQAKPDYWEARYWLGKTYEMMEEIPQAVNEWKTILQQQPNHSEAFKKWRYYAASQVSISNQERQNLENVFLYQNGSPEVYLNNPWDIIIPYGLVIMKQNDFISAFLSARLFRWAGSQISGLLSGYADASYQKALDLAAANLPEDSELIFQLIKDVTSYYSQNNTMQKKVENLYQSILAQQTGLSVEETTNTSQIEIRVTASGIERGPVNNLDQNGSNPRFYIDTDID